MFDITAIGAWLLSQGGWGVAVAYLLWDRYSLSKRIESSQDAHRQDLQMTVAKVTEAVVTSSEVIRANTLSQDRTSLVMSGLNDGVKAVQASILGMEKDLDRMERGSGT